MKHIFFIILGLSTVLLASYSKNGNIVIDHRTGIQWQDDTDDSTMTWTEAIDYCDALTLDGYSDWRLPNINELISIVDDTRPGEIETRPRVDISVFKNMTSDSYWSSTSYAISIDETLEAWYIYFKFATVYHRDKEVRNHARCVR